MAKYTPDPESLASRASIAIETGADFESRTLYLIGEITEQTSFEMLVGLRTMDEGSGTIRIVLHSLGGDETSGYAIHDAIRSVRSRVAIEVYGACQSIAAMILQAGDRRLMAPEAEFMIHNGYVGMDERPNADAVIEKAKRVRRENDHYARILAKRSGMSLEEVKRLCRAETFFGAREAVRYGFADAVIRMRKRR